MNGPPEILLIYDGQCPACSYYASVVRIRESVGELVLVDAREPGDAVDEVTAAGLDLDQGAVLKIGDQLHYGADAMHMLAMLSSRSGVFNRLAFWCFRSKWRSRILYPALRSARNLLLLVLGREKIENVRQHGSHRLR